LQQKSSGWTALAEAWWEELSSESLGGASFRLGRFFFPTLRRCIGFERAEQTTRDARYFFDCTLEGIFVGLGWLAETADLSDELQGRSPDLVVSHGRIKIKQGLDVSAHHFNLNHRNAGRRSWVSCRHHFNNPASYHRPMNSELPPTTATDLALLGVLDELVSREPIFHRPELGTTRADYENMTTADFWEVGASGRRYSGEEVLAELDRRREAPPVDVWEATGFHCRELAENVFLLTYTLLQDNRRKTRRATIWQRTPESWKIVFHQGTIVQDE
jgi:hypothetical protein